MSFSVFVTGTQKVYERKIRQYDKDMAGCYM